MTFAEYRHVIHHRRRLTITHLAVYNKQLLTKYLNIALVGHGNNYVANKAKLIYRAAYNSYLQRWPFGANLTLCYDNGRF